MPQLIREYLEISVEMKPRFALPNVTQCNTVQYNLKSRFTTRNKETYLNAVYLPLCVLWGVLKNHVRNLLVLNLYLGDKILKIYEYLILYTKLHACVTKVYINNFALNDGRDLLRTEQIARPLW